MNLPRKQFKPGHVVDHHFGVHCEDYQMIMLSWLANRQENREDWGTYIARFRYVSSMLLRC